jgi:hypothetical protein
MLWGSFYSSLSLELAEGAFVYGFMGEVDGVE